MDYLRLKMELEIIKKENNKYRSNYDVVLEQLQKTNNEIAEIRKDVDKIKEERHEIN